MKTLSLAIVAAALTLIALIPVLVVIWRGMDAVRGLLAG